MQNPETSKQNKGDDPIHYPTVTAVKLKAPPPSDDVLVEFTLNENVNSFGYTVQLVFSGETKTLTDSSPSIVNNVVTFTEPKFSKDNQAITVHLDTHRQDNVTFENLLNE